jgi:threonyl-tRNA synthetase
MNNDLDMMRHSLSHILASAVSKEYKNIKLGFGPSVDNGFYYDFDLGEESISEDDFKVIEKEMRKIIAEKLDFVKEEKSYEDAVKWVKNNDQPYKLELIEELKDNNEQISFYTCGGFTDLCRGPHVNNTGEVGVFKLLRVAGAYWRGDEKREQMQRLYGVAFETEDELKAYLLQLEEAKNRDHRKLGKELDLFTISELVGPGLPLFSPRGTILRKELLKLSEELERSIGYEETWCPHMTRAELYKVSGHYDKYPERFDVSSAESDDEFILKPMNCPHHTQIFASKPHSYRDMPVRYMESTTMYRDEKSGELHGLSRVRSLTQDDSHAFVRYDQIETEIHNIVSIIKKIYSVLDMTLSVELSFRDDSDNYYGDPGIWKNAQGILEKIAKEEELDYRVELGEAAFYGPKIDIYITDAIGRRWQCATVQLDYVMPERFELEYIDENGKPQRPAMIHKAILGSIERFLSVYIEHTAGKFPVWCSPEQLRIIKVKDDPKVDEFCNDVVKTTTENGIRVYFDDSNNSVGKKIRSAEVAKVPYSVVIGEQEVEKNILPIRVRSDLGEDEELSVQALVEKIVNENRERSK